MNHLEFAAQESYVIPSDEEQRKRLSPFLAEYYGADFVDELKMDIVRNNYACSNKILANPAQFPNANFDRVQQVVIELELAFIGQL